MGKVPWSPKLQRYRDEITAWINLRRYKSGIKVSRRYLNNLFRKINITSYTDYEPEFSEEKINKAFDEYKQARQKAEMWRDDWECVLAKDLAKQNNTSYEIELKKLQTVKYQRKIASAVKRVRGKFNNPTAKVYVNDCDSRVECNTKFDIEHACMQEYSKRRSQTESSPPMNLPLLPDLGYLCDGPAIEDILTGVYVPDPTTDLYACQLLKHLKMPSAIKEPPLLENIISVEDHIQSWKKQKEGVASEPSGLSFSHYKAGIEDDIIAQYNATIRSLPYQYGFVPEKWKTMTDVAILKKAGVYDINKMRTIVLMNAEYNMNIKNLAKRLWPMQNYIKPLHQNNMVVERI